MRITSDTIANVATVVTCGVMVAFVAPQLKPRWAATTDTARVARNRDVDPVDGVVLKMPERTVKARAGARVAVIEFSDFQCPFCGRFARESVATLQKEFVDSGKVAYAFRNFPLVNTPTGCTWICRVSSSASTVIRAPSTRTSPKRVAPE
jgi:protein-disulfide isomerase